MADLKTTYMGIELRNPIIAGASEMTSDVDTIKRLAEAGVGALVTKSLFEEQVQLQQHMFNEDLEKFNYRYAEMISVFPNLQFAGPEEHLMWVRKTKEAVDVPVIASLNEHRNLAGIRQALGRDGRRCVGMQSILRAHGNRTDGRNIVSDQVSLVAELKKTVKIPVSVKLSHFYTNPLNVISRMDEAGADAFVLFNRPFEPDFDIKTLTHCSPFNFSGENDYRLSLRYAGLLYGQIEADICAATGILCGESVVKMILAGATAVQTVTALYRHGVEHVGKMLATVEEWMNTHGYNSLADFRGGLSRRNTSEPWAYTRAQYAKLLMNPKQVVENAPVR